MRRRFQTLTDVSFPVPFASELTSCTLSLRNALRHAAPGIPDQIRRSTIVATRRRSFPGRRRCQGYTSLRSTGALFGSINGRQGR